MANLSQYFQAINQFVSPRIPQYIGFAEVNKELAKIAPLFHARQLSLQIFSQFPLLSEGIKNFFNTHQGLRNFYSSKISDLPVKASVNQTNQSSILILRGNSGVGQSEARYTLSPTQTILIGRELQHHSDAKLINIPLPMYKKVSGRHAEIQSVTNIASSTQSWQICDLNSTNGTYIDGQKIKGCQVLKSGNKITLSYPTASEKAPEFIFESHDSVLTSSVSSPNLIDGHLILLIIHPTKELNSFEKQLIEQVSKASISGFVIVADVSGTKPQDSPVIGANLSSIQSWIRTQYPHLASSLEVTTLPLHPFYSSLPSQLSPEVESRFTDFAVNFIELAKQQGAELLAGRINHQLQIQIQRIEQILTSQEKALEDEIKRTESTLNGRTLEYWRDYYYNQVRRQVEEDRDDFFREAKSQFSRIRDDFATDITSDNLLQRIDAYVNRLEPVVTRLNGQVCIQLRLDNGQDLHTAMIRFCQTELNHWGNDLWKKICHSINGYGLEGFLKQSYAQLNCLPEFQLTNIFTFPSTQLNFTHQFNISFSEVKADISYSESSGDAFGGVAKIAMLAASTAISAAMMSPYAVIQGASAVSALGSFVGSSLSRPQQEKLRLVQVVDSLRRNTINHYRNIARYLLSRVAQEISSAIDAEDRRFRKARDTADEQMRKYFIEIENISRGYRVRQEILYKDRVVFEQIKRLGG